MQCYHHGIELYTVMAKDNKPYTRHHGQVPVLCSGSALAHGCSVMTASTDWNVMGEELINVRLYYHRPNVSSSERTPSV